MKLSKFHKSVLALVALCLFCSCADQSSMDGVFLDDSFLDGDHIMFGQVGAYCDGPCHKLYLLTEAGLYLSVEAVNEDGYAFDVQALPEQKIELAQSLWNAPQELVQQQFTEDDLVQILSDTDFYISGKLSNSSFRMAYDSIDSVSAPTIYTYSRRMQEIFLALD